MKFVLNMMMILSTLSNLYAEPVLLRFQSHIESNARFLGDLLIIENDNHHWAKLPLHSHPSAGEWIHKDTLITWMKSEIGPIDLNWEGITKIKVHESTVTSADALLQKAKMALIEQLKPQYHKIEVVSLSYLKDSEFPLDSFQPVINLSYPTAKRVCVWLKNENKQLPVWFSVQASAKVLVAQQQIKANTPLQESTFAWEEHNIAGLKEEPILAYPTDSWSQSLIQKNHILLKSQLKKAPQISKGQEIKVHFNNQSIHVVMDALALAEGYENQNITVQNPINHETFIARVTGQGQAEVRS